MTPTTRVSLFIVWLAVVTLGCLDMAYSSPAVFGSIVLPIACLPFLPRAQFTRGAPRAVGWMSLAVVAGLLVFIIWGATSGFNQASNAWFEQHPVVRVCAAAILWLTWLTLGYKRFAANRFLV